MWDMIAKEMGLPWRAVESMHWTMGPEDMAARANVPVFQSHVAGPGHPSASMRPQSASMAAAPSRYQQHYSTPYQHHEHNPSKSPTIAGSDSSLGPGNHAGSVGRRSDSATPAATSAPLRHGSIGGGSPQDAAARAHSDDKTYAHAMAEAEELEARHRRRRIQQEQMMQQQAHQHPQRPQHQQQHSQHSQYSQHSPHSSHRSQPSHHSQHSQHSQTSEHSQQYYRRPHKQNGSRTPSRERAAAHAHSRSRDIDYEHHRERRYERRSAAAAAAAAIKAEARLEGDEAEDILDADVAEGRDEAESNGNGNAAKPVVDGPLPDESLSPVGSLPSAAGSDWERGRGGVARADPRTSVGSAGSASPAAPIVAGAYVESPVGVGGEEGRGRGRD
jgi:hypothetical protein